jgi:hypothetical protein
MRQGAHQCAPGLIRRASGGAHTVFWIANDKYACFDEIRFPEQTLNLLRHNECSA